MVEDREPNEASAEALFRLRLVSLPNIKLGYPAEAGHPELSISLHIATVWELYEVVQKIGPERAAKIAMVGAMTHAAVLNFDESHYDEAQRTIQERTGEPDFYSLALNLMKTIERFHRGKTYKDTVIGFTYDLLHARKISRDDAAAVASILLERHFTSEAWRKQVDRYLELHPELPKVGQRKPKKKRK